MRKVEEVLSEEFGIEPNEVCLLDEKYDDAFIGASANMEIVAYGYERLYDILSKELNNAERVESIIDRLGEENVLIVRNGNADDESLLLEPRESLDEALIGATQSGRAVYDYDLLVNSFMANEEMSESEAVEWISYNTLRSLPYYPNAPYVVIMSDLINE